MRTHAQAPLKLHGLPDLLQREHEHEHDHERTTARPRTLLLCPALPGPGSDTLAPSRVPAVTSDFRRPRKYVWYCFARVYAREQRRVRAAALAFAIRTYTHRCDLAKSPSTAQFLNIRAQLHPSASRDARGRARTAAGVTAPHEGLRCMRVASGQGPHSSPPLQRTGVLGLLAWLTRRFQLHVLSSEMLSRQPEARRTMSMYIVHTYGHVGLGRPAMRQGHIEAYCTLVHVSKAGVECEGEGFRESSDSKPTQATVFPWP